MRKTSIYFGASLVLVGLIALAGPKLCSLKTCGSSSEPSEQAAYVALFNQRLAELPEWDEDEVEHEKYNQPDMFAAFDRLKRMDPRTGEVPANGLSNA
jgi:hypothetical protein